MKSSRITASSISCCALLGVFVIENHCGLDAVDHFLRANQIFR